MHPQKGSVNPAADEAVPSWSTAHLPHQSWPAPAAMLGGHAALSCPLLLRFSSLRTSGSSSSTCSSSNWKLSSGEAGAAAWGSRSTTVEHGRRSWSKRSSSSSRYVGLGKEGSVLAARSAQGVTSRTLRSGQREPGSSLTRS